MVRESGRTCSNGFKLDRCRFNKNIMKNWFTSRMVVDEWNRLGNHVVSAHKIDTIKESLDEFMDD